MKKILNEIIAYIKPQEGGTIGLTSFKPKQPKFMTNKKPQIINNNSLNFNLLHK